jgi:hypothetical protein
MGCIELSQVAERSEVDPQDRHSLARGQPERAEHRPIASEGQNHITSSGKLRHGAKLGARGQPRILSRPDQRDTGRLRPSRHAIKDRTHLPLRSQHQA